MVTAPARPEGVSLSQGGGAAEVSGGGGRTTA